MPGILRFVRGRSTLRGSKKKAKETKDGPGGSSVAGPSSLEATDNCYDTVEPYLYDEPMAVRWPQGKRSSVISSRGSSREPTPPSRDGPSPPILAMRGASAPPSRSHSRQPSGNVPPLLRPRKMSLGNVGFPGPPAPLQARKGAGRSASIGNDELHFTTGSGETMYDCVEGLHEPDTEYDTPETLMNGTWGQMVADTEYDVPQTFSEGCFRRPPPGSMHNPGPLLMYDTPVTPEAGRPPKPMRRPLLSHTLSDTAVVAPQACKTSDLDKLSMLLGNEPFGMAAASPFGGPPPPVPVRSLGASPPGPSQAYCGAEPPAIPMRSQSGSPTNSASTAFMGHSVSPDTIFAPTVPQRADTPPSLPPKVRSRPPTPGHKTRQVFIPLKSR